MNENNNNKQLEYERQKELYEAAKEDRREVREDLKSDIESYHKIIAILSSLLPVFSIGLMKFLDVKNTHLFCLKCSWVFFFMSLFAGLLGIFIKMRGGRSRMSNIEKYYLNDDKNAFNKAILINRAASIIETFAFVLFSLGVIVLVVFLWLSI